MDFHLTKEQLLVRKMYREFAENEVNPTARRDRRGRAFPHGDRREDGEAGHDGHLLPLSMAAPAATSSYAVMRGGAGQGLRHHCRYRFRSYLSVLRSHFRARHRGSETKVSALTCCPARRSVLSA